MLKKSDIKSLIASALVSFHSLVMEQVAADISTAVSDHNAVNATASQAGHMTAKQASKLDGIEEGAQVNQNALAKVKVGSTTIAAGNATDTVEFEAGDNISVTADDTTKKVTVSATYGTFTQTTDGLVPKYNSNTANLYLGTTGWKAIQSASTAGSGIVQLVDAVDSADAGKAATANAVKTALDQAKAYADEVKSELLGDTPIDALDTLKELGDALGNDKDFAATMTNALANKSDKTHTHVGSDLKVGTYAEASSIANIATTDTIAVALGKVEHRVKSLADGGADKWTEAIDFNLTGAVTGTVSVDGSQDVTLNTTLSNLASNKVNAMTGYSLASISSKADVAAADSLNTAVAKVEYRIKNLNLSDLFGTDTTGASLAQYGIADAYTLTQGNALDGRVSTLETLCNTTLSGAEDITNQDVLDIMEAVNKGLA